MNLVLLGMAGVGKSASGNMILGQKRFASKPDSKPVTQECQVEETEIDGVHVRVIDTPDIFSDEINPADKKRHVTKCKELCDSGTCVYLLVLQLSRFTDGERDILKKFERAFGCRAQKQAIILFTRGNDLQHGQITFDEFLRTCQPDLKQIIQQCGKRCVVFENNSGFTNTVQVKKLMQTVEMVLAEDQKF